MTDRKAEKIYRYAIRKAGKTLAKYLETPPRECEEINDVNMAFIVAEYYGAKQLTQLAKRISKREI